MNVEVVRMSFLSRSCDIQLDKECYSSSRLKRFELEKSSFGYTTSSDGESENYIVPPAISLRLSEFLKKFLLGNTVPQSYIKMRAFANDLFKL